MYSKPVAIEPRRGEFYVHYNQSATPIKVILWEGLSSEDQESYRVDLQEDEHWVIWCKAQPKDIATQTFRTYGSVVHL